MGTVDATTSTMAVATQDALVVRGINMQEPGKQSTDANVPVYGNPLSFGGVSSSNQADEAQKGALSGTEQKKIMQTNAGSKKDKKTVAPVQEFADDKQLEEELNSSVIEFREAQLKLIRCKNAIAAKTALLHVKLISLMLAQLRQKLWKTSPTQTLIWKIRFPSP